MAYDKKVVRFLAEKFIARYTVIAPPPEPAIGIRQIIGESGVPASLLPTGKNLAEFLEAVRQILPERWDRTTNT